MSVRLTIWQFPGHKSANSYMHPIYPPLMMRMTSEPDYNGGLVQFNSMKVQFEFVSQEDLTQFVLAWS